jgi:riboflavin synthase
MFSGIVEGMGTVAKIVKKENLYVLSLRAEKFVKGTRLGDSISVDGVCLTVTKREQKGLSFDLMKETLGATIMKDYEPGRQVNLEKSLRMDSRLGGHFVTGHVDGVGSLTKILTLPNYVEWRIAAQPDLARYIVPKGSVCLDGVSLTVGKVWKDAFSVYLIPHTLKVTTFGDKNVGARLNIETDILAKYVLSNQERQRNNFPRLSNY